MAVAVTQLRRAISDVEAARESTLIYADMTRDPLVFDEGEQRLPLIQCALVPPSGWQRSRRRPFDSTLDLVTRTWVWAMPRGCDLRH